MTPPLPFVDLMAPHFWPKYNVYLGGNAIAFLKAEDSQVCFDVGEKDCQVLVMNYTDQERSGIAVWELSIAENNRSGPEIHYVLIDQTGREANTIYFDILDPIIHARHLIGVRRVYEHPDDTCPVGCVRIVGFRLEPA